MARWAGLDTRVPSRDMESCAQYVMTKVHVDQDAIDSHFGDRIAPGGYAWVFPKGVDSANVGLGVVALAPAGATRGSGCDDYTQSYFPTGVRLGYTVGRRDRASDRSGAR